MSRQREWRPAWPCPVASILGTHRRGRGDPTYAITGNEHWRAMRTPLGPGTLRVTALAADGVVRAQAWGSGAPWLLDQLPQMLGADDDPTGFEVSAPLLVAAQRTHRHWRLGRTGLVFESLLPTIIEQKVTGKEAFGSYARLVRRFGEPAPGPTSGPDSGPDSGPALRVPPSPERVCTIPSWEWLRLGIDSQRARTIVGAAGRANSLERIAAVAPEEADRRLQSLPGIGVWTSAEVRARALGDADAVSFGDYHVAAQVGWVLTGAPVDDEALAELLEPYRPHRHRIQALVSLARLGPPRRGPRHTLPTHLPG